MSLHQLANHMSAQGRGPDSTLVHMSPREVSGLQSLAMAHGGTLTINPQTGLPEAGFLDSLLPTLIGGAATYFTGGAINPAVIAAAVGGITALTSKDLGKGLMAGLGAYGGSSIVSGLAGFGAEALGSEAATAALPSGASSVSGDYDLLQAQASNAAQTGASYSDKLSRGVTEGFKNPMGAVKAVGDGSTFKGVATLAGPAMAAFSAVDEPKTSIPEKSKTAFIRSFYKDPVTGQKMANPAIPAEDFGNRTLGEQYFAANGGLIALAGGGQTAYDYLDRKRSTSSDAGIVDDTPPKPRLPPLGSDGKGSYTYNKDSKTWVWTPDAKPVVPVNPGVQTLMDTGGPGGYDGGDIGSKNPVGGPPNYAYGDSSYGAPGSQNTDIGFLSSLLGNKGQMPAPIEDRMAEQDAKSISEIAGLLNGLTTTGADIRGGQFAGGIASLGVDPATGLAPGELGGRDPAPAAAPAAPAAAPAAEAETGFTSLAQGQLDRDAAMNAKIAAENAAIDAAAKEKADKAADIAAAIARATEREAAQAQIDEKAQADRETANMARQVEAQAQAQQAQEAQAQANREASTSTAPAPDAGPSSGSESGGGYGEGLGSGYDKAKGGYIGRYAQGGLGSLGGYSDGGRLLRGPGDGVSDSIPATVGGRQPARLADGEFVVPARIVSELGNGSTEAGARALYKMMDRIQANRRKTTGKNSVAVNSKSHKYLPA